MEKDRSTKIIAIIALLVAVVGLSLGFAAYSTSLTINPSASVKRDEDKFKVVFSSGQDDNTAGKVDGVVKPEDPDKAVGGQANIQELTVSNAEAVFSKDNQTITYTWYVRNTGELTAYLRGVTFANSNKPTECTASGDGAEGATDSLIQTACQTLSATLKVHGHDYTSTTDSGFTSEDKVEAGSNTTVELVITAGAGATLVDSDYKATFGAITLNYQSAPEA